MHVSRVGKHEGDAVVAGRVIDKRRLADVTILVNKGGQSAAYPKGFTPIPANQQLECVCEMRLHERAVSETRCVGA